VDSAVGPDLSSSTLSPTPGDSKHILDESLSRPEVLLLILLLFFGVLPVWCCLGFA